MWGFKSYVENDMDLKKGNELVFVLPGDLRNANFLSLKDI